MAIRVTDAEVKEIIGTSLSTDPFITAASLLVDQHLADKGLSDDILKEIERWLAAHFVAVRDPNLRSESVMDTTEVKQVGYLGKGLEFTAYGQQVALLDSTGTLASVGRKRAEISLQ